MTDTLSDSQVAKNRITALQQRASIAALQLRNPPAEPTTCCGRGCNGCVWEGYYGAVDYWCEEALLRLEAD